MAADFSTWINAKYKEWARGKIGIEGSVSAFGRLFGATHQVITAWLRPGSLGPVKNEYRDKLIAMYGDEAYDALGIPRPRRDNSAGEPLTEEQRQALALFNEIPVDDRDSQAELLALLEHYLFRHGFRKTK